MDKKTDMRAVALDTLLDMDRNKKLSHIAIGETLMRYQFAPRQDRAFYTHLCEGVTERRIYLDYVLDTVSRTPMRKCKPLIRNLLRMGAYQILFMKVPDAAACNEAASLAKKRGFRNLAGFVNGVLRNLARQKEKLSLPDRKQSLVHFLSVVYSMPDWIVELLISQYGEKICEKILASFLEVRPLTIRTNLSKISAQELRNILVSEGVNVEDAAYLPYAFYLSEFNYLGKLPSFREGFYAVQDLSSMLAVSIADIRAGDLILDICAAPGGKTFHAADRLALSEQRSGKTESGDSADLRSDERESCDPAGQTSDERETFDSADLRSDEREGPSSCGRIISRDLTEYKTQLIEENRERMGFSQVEIEQWDACVPDEKLIGQADLVLADLPCSGLGIMGRKNDIKYHIDKEQLHELVELQRSILKNACQYVKPGGQMIYSTCTLNQKENVGNVSWIEENTPLRLVSIEEALPEELKGRSGKDGYLQLIPGRDSCDGFFFAKFVNKGNVS